MNFLRLLNKHLEKTILVILLTTILLTMLLQIVMRYFFNYSLAWPEELCRYSFIWFMFVAFSYSIQANIDLRVDSVVNMLPVKIQEIVNKATVIIGFLFTAFMFTNSFETVSNVYKTGEYSVAMKLPLYYVYISVVVGFG
ncbi:MAG: TRAP transporter small permease, partial [Sedimentibacter sp.]